MSSLDIYSPPAPRILDFDIENRPLTYLGKDFTTAEVTAIAASFGQDEAICCWYLPFDSPWDMLCGFRGLYDQADIVTGHYILKHDLPMINGAMLEHGMPSLGPKLVSDTYVHLKAIRGVSKSQESLSDMLGVQEPKQYMSQADWRAANRYEDVELTIRRVSSDVRQHQELRLALIRAGMLGPPRMWRGD